MPFSKQLPPPPKAHIKHSKDETGTTTGYRNSAEKRMKAPRRRARARRSHEYPPKTEDSPPEDSTPEDSIWAYFEKEAEKEAEKEDDKEKPPSCVFLLWGSENSERSQTWAVDVPTTRTRDEEDIFELLTKRYANEIGLWRRWFSFRKPSRIKPVTFRFICRSSKRFSAFIEPLDLAKDHQIYSERKEKVFPEAKAIVDHDFDGFPIMCERGRNGEYEHRAAKCPVRRDEGEECPFVELDVCDDGIRWIETISLLSCYFHDPTGARSQSILKGFGAHHFKYQYDEIGPSGWNFELQTRYEQLDGLYVETAWDPIKCRYFFLFFLILLACTLVVGKLYWGSWEIAFGAGSFLVALPMLILTVLNYCDV